MKAILVIEMPSKCCNCMFEDGSYCELKEAALDDVFSTKIPNDCHLKLLPRFKHPNGSDIVNDYVRGYNDCLTEILGETDDRNI